MIRENPAGSHFGRMERRMFTCPQHCLPEIPPNCLWLVKSNPVLYN
ncbi:hypothetical protein CBFG_00030 [Clostridiales bacterium 1_7_47FAA]|nr:hypothetical protein CBFG_00030 [Clostridiales bacterium 1_7_47FAA]